MSAEPTPLNAVPGPVYLTAEEAAELLRRSVKTLYRLVKLEPSMPALKLGGAVLFPRERLLKWLRDREQGRAHPMRQKLRSARKSASAQESATS
jgi:excisionase family DNA binding protein